MEEEWCEMGRDRRRSETALVTKGKRLLARGGFDDGGYGDSRSSGEVDEIQVDSEYLALERKAKKRGL